MSSQAQASLELPGVLGLASLGFPLHPAKRVAVDRAEHLSKVNSQCSSCRERAMSWPICQTCVPPCERATLHLIEDADHVFHVRARLGRTDQQVIGEIAACVAAWTRALVGRAR